MNKPVHFKDEIEHSFITYALIPAIMFAVIMILVSVFVWNWNLYRRTRSENFKITDMLAHTTSAYGKQAAQNFPVPVSCLTTDRNAVASVYASLKEFVLKQRVQADFVVLSKSYDVLLQGDSGQPFIVPGWQNDFYWGTLGRMKSRPGQIITEISSDYSTDKQPEIIIGRTLVEATGVEGYLLFMFSRNAIREQITSMLPFAVTNRWGELFLASSSQYQNQMHELSAVYRRPNIFYFTSKNAAFHSTTSDACFDVYTFSDTEQLKSGTVTLLLMTLMLLGLMIKGLFVSASKISEEKSRTIDKIVDAYKHIENGDLDNRLFVDSNIEFRTIADAYNEMLNDIKRLLEENRREVQEKYVVELKQLEMQFNPHFMYNTLETIKFLIKLDPDKARKTIIRLSNLLRYSITSDVSVVPIKDDIQYIESYLWILKMRFGSRFEYRIDVSDILQTCLTPKLILQPLIGNSIKYGFKDRCNMKLLIVVRPFEDKVIVSVEDNGAGMDPSRLQEIRSLLAEDANRTRHLGLYNVQRRLRLMYGKGYGVEIESSKGNGTVAKILLPYITGTET